MWLRTGISSLPEEDVLLDVTSLDVSDGQDDVRQFEFLQGRNLLLSEEAVLFVLKPEPVSVSQPLKLVLDDLGEERPRPTVGLQHASHVEIQVHHVPVVHLLQPSRETISPVLPLTGSNSHFKGVFIVFELLRIDLTEITQHGEPETFPDGVVVRQPVVSSSHDIEGGQITPRELHRAEEIVSHVAAEDGILPLTDLTGQTQ